jgi:hypothetical protein
MEELRMALTEIVAGIDAEIAKLREAKALLSGNGSRATTLGVRSAGNGLFAARIRKKHIVSAEGRARIAAAQRARWAKQKKVNK